MAEIVDVVAEAIGRLRTLPRAQAEFAASVLLEEMASEEQWIERFLKSQSELAAWADEALQELHDNSVPNRDPADLV